MDKKKITSKHYSGYPTVNWKRLRKRFCKRVMKAKTIFLKQKSISMEELLNNED